MFREKYIFILVFLLFHCFAFSQNNEDINSTQVYDEGIFQMVYSSAFRVNMICLIYNKETYIPLLQTLDNLKIDYRLNFEKQIIEGSYLHPDSLYAIDFLNQKIVYNNSEQPIEKTDFIKYQTDFYVLPSLIKKVFMFDAEVMRSKLLVLINSDNDLPILAEYKRAKKYNSIENRFERENYFPLRFDRNQSFLNGGILDYTIKANNYKDENWFNWDLKSGLEILGGDLQWNYTGAYNQKQNSIFYNNNFRWRYFFGENNYLTQFQVGYLNNSGYRVSSLPAKQFRGFQISNEKTMNETFFSDIIIQDYIEPGWQVELYQDGKLINQMRSDPQGYYKFNLPINYGNSNLELQYYGLKGEFVKKQMLIKIPVELYQPGEVKYLASYGERYGDNLRFFEGRLGIGFTSWLSNTINVTRYDQFPELDDLEVINSTTVGLTSDFLMTFDYFNNYYYRGLLRYWTSNNGNHDIYYKKYFKLSPYNPEYRDYSFAISSSIPAFSGLPFNILLKGNLDKFQHFSNVEIANTIFVNTYPLQLFFDYNALFNLFDDTRKNVYIHFVAFSGTYYINNARGLASFFNGSSFRLGSSLNLSDYPEMKLGALRFGYTHSFSDLIYLQLTMTRDFYIRNYLDVALSVRINLPFARSTTEAKYYGRYEGVYSEELQGTIGLVSSEPKLIFANSSTQSTVGNGAIDIRIFLDDNLNSIYDEGDVLIPNARVSIPQASTDNRSKTGTIQVYNLLPYVKYNVTVDRASLKNPLWIPAFTEFAFIADPNVYKPIDIPCYAGAVIEGRVQRNEADSLSGQAGVKVHIMSRDSTYRQAVPVFSDGSFYYMGVPPGDYIAFVDSLQMAILDVKPSAPYSEFKVKRTTEGDYVGNLNFELLPNRIVRKRPSEPVQKAPEDQGLRRPADTTTKDKPLAVAPAGTKPKDKKVQEATPPPVPIEANKLKVFTYKATKDVLLTSEMRRYLDAVANWMEANPRCEVSIVGHTDNFGALEATQELSEMRSTTAANYLTSKGIERGRILTSGEGSRNPISSNMTPEGRRKNRRIEITVIE